MKKWVLAAAGGLALYIAVTRGHNVVRYVWLNWGQDPEDWIPMFGQKLPNPVSVEWGRFKFPGKSFSPPSKLLMLQSYTKNIAPYADLSAEINRRYCEGHGYRYKAIVSDNPDPQRSPCWNKVYYIKEEMKSMQDGEWIFWLDSDAAIDHPYLEIEDIAATMDKRSSGCADIGICASIPFTKNVNTGAMLIRVTPYTRAFMEEWWNWPNLRWRQGMCHEQSALDEMMAKDASACCSFGKIAMFGPTEFNGTFQHGLRMRGNFLQHYRGCSTEKRVAAFEDILLHINKTHNGQR
jgi:hypothetical protein